MIAATFRMRCKKCAIEKEPKDLIEGTCVDCVVEMGSKLRTLTKEEIRRAKALVESETAGLFSPGLLQGVLEELLSDVEAGEEAELAVVKASNAIQRLGGIGMCREMIRIADSLGSLGREIEEEARRKIGVLSRLGKGDET